MRKIVLLILLLLVGCAMPVYKKIETPSTPTTVRGHSLEKRDQLMFYKAPEEIWPDDFKPAPKVCGSPFQGKLISR